MFQTLVIIATIVVLSGAILTSSLVSAKNALHQIVVAKTQTAMTDATSQFVFWAQKFVANYGTEADWNAKGAQQAPMFVPLCDAKANCPYNATIEWKVTGATVGVAPAAGAAQVVSTAQNMAPAVDEQRISATISVIITDATGRTTYGGRTQEVTARVFDASPYVVVTGTHDLSSDVGVAKNSQGDSAGSVDKQGNGKDLGTPDPSQPAGFVSTIIRTTIDCNNTNLFDESNPFSTNDNGTSLVDYSYRQGGAQAWAYQIPCVPTYGVPQAPQSIQNYSPPFGTRYEIGSSDSNSTWKTGDEDVNAFPQ